jgi:hypothetical protein
MRFQLRVRVVYNLALIPANIAVSEDVLNHKIQHGLHSGATEVDLVHLLSDQVQPKEKVFVLLVLADNSVSLLSLKRG